MDFNYRFFYKGLKRNTFWAKAHTYYLFPLRPKGRNYLKGRAIQRTELFKGQNYSKV